MNYYSLRTLIDDILLIVRNNNISESEDLSRSLIAAWIFHYKAMLAKQQQDKEDEAAVDEFDDSMTKEIGPVELEDVESYTDCPTFTRKTKDKLSDLLNNNPGNIIAIYDSENCPILFMHGQRKHFHRFRKYTGGELTYDWNDGHIYVHGISDCGTLRYIWIKYISSGEDAENEDDVNIPGWMIPQIKDFIFKNELSFMIKMPSDDDNNSTLDGIKPHGPQDQEK